MVLMLPLLGWKGGTVIGSLPTSQHSLFLFCLLSHSQT
uniref:Uncharacterized protein n=1 Tax=Rhizophora mucronata TaxID=61149 RepID=A0A2P2PD58_RHIMU